MRDWDRFWWLILIVGLALCAGAVAAPYFLAHIMPPGAMYITNAEYWQLIGVLGLVVLIFLSSGLLLISWALRDRRLHLRRLAALHGDERAMPLAEIHPDPALARDLSEAPLELMWRVRVASRVFYVLTVAVRILFVIGFISLGAFMYVVATSRYSPPLPTPQELLNRTPPQPMSLIEIILLAVMACAIVAVCVAMGLLYARMMPYHLGRPFGVSASNSGIDAYTELGSRIHMAWDEMRLLEVQTGGGFAKRCFSLYAPGKRIDWAEYSTGLGTRYVPVGATSSDMTRRQAALLGLIVARTGLAPRTLAKTLVSKPAKALEHKATKAQDVKRLSKGVVLLAGISAAGFLFPVTPSALVNWASAGSLAFLALWLLLLTLRLALARSMSSAHANPPAVDAPSLDAPDVAYSFNWRIPLLGRLGFMVAGLCLAVNLVPGVWGLVQQVTFVVSHLHPQLLTTGILITLLVTVGRFMLAFSSSLGYLEWCWPTWRRSWRKFTFAWTGTA